MNNRARAFVAVSITLASLACSSTSVPAALPPPTSGVDIPATQGTGVIVPGDGNTTVGDSNAQLPGNANSSSAALTDLLTGSGSGNGQAVFQGNVASTPFKPASAAYDVLGSGTTPAYMVMVFSTDATICSTIATSHALPKSAILTEAVFTNLDPNAQLQALNPNAAYTVTASQQPPAGPAVSFAFFDLDSGCHQSLASAYTSASSGSVNLRQATLVGNGNADGTFAMEMGTQSDAVSGTFTAIPCPGLAAQLLDPNGQPGCQ